MKTLKLSRSQHQVVQKLTRKDFSVLRKHPRLLSESRYLLRALKASSRTSSPFPNMRAGANAKQNTSGSQSSAGKQSTCLKTSRLQHQLPQAQRRNRR
jgi:hypothetical protein